MPRGLQYAAVPPSKDRAAVLGDSGKLYSTHVDTLAWTEYGIAKSTLLCRLPMSAVGSSDAASGHSTTATCYYVVIIVVGAGKIMARFWIQSASAHGSGSHNAKPSARLGIASVQD